MTFTHSYGRIRANILLWMNKPLWHNTGFRWKIGVVAVVLTILGVAGVGKLEFNDQYRKIFKSDSEEFTAFNEFNESFDGGANRWIILVESTNSTPLISEKLVPILREFDFELRSQDFSESVFSIFNGRSRHRIEDYFPPLIPGDDAEAGEFAKADNEARDHPAIGGVLLSRDGLSAIWSVSQGRDDHPVEELKSVYVELNEIAAQFSDKHSLQIRTTGLPAIRCEAISLLYQENKIFYPLVAFAGILACWLLFRNLAAVTIAVAAPLVGSLWALGLMGWAGEPMNVINNILAPLITVIGFSDGVHLVFHFKRLKAKGIGRVEAAWRSLVEIGPACLLTSVTTGVALLALLFTETTIIQRFGVTAAISTFIMFLAVIVVTPLLAASPLGDRIGEESTSKKPRPAIWKPLGDMVTRWSGRITLISLVWLVVSLILASRLQVNYRNGEYLPSDNPAVHAIHEIDTKLAGSSIITFIVKRKTPPANLAEWLPVISDIENVIESEKIFGPPGSLLTLLRALPSEGTEQEQLDRLQEMLPEGAFRALVDESGTTTLVGASLPEIGGNKLNELLNRLQPKIDSIGDSHPGISIRPTGIPVLTARVSSTMISELAASLFFAGGIIFILIGIFLRSVPLGLATLLPNLLPLGATAALLYLTGQPLQYHSVLMFTICLGIAVDDSIHLLVRYRHHRQQENADVDSSLKSAICEVGPTLLTTSSILVAGLGVLIFSRISVSQIFGSLSCLAIILALIADLFFLPASLSFIRKLFDRFSTRS